MCAEGYVYVWPCASSVGVCFIEKFTGIGTFPNLRVTTERSRFLCPFEGTVNVIEDTSLLFRHCVNYKPQSCRVCRAKGVEMFSESVKGLLKSLTNTLVFITVVTSTIVLFPSSVPLSLLVSCAVTHTGCISVEKSSRFIKQD